LQSHADVVDFASLTRFEQLGGRGCATKVQTETEVPQFFVFKGIDFRTFLTYCDGGEDDDDNVIKHMIKTWHHANNVISSMPPHPNILPPPTTFVTIQDPKGGGTPVVCGCLYPFFSKGDVRARIEASNKTGVRIPLGLKARWCAQMAAAIKHTHLIAHSYHMDIKPGNFLIDDDENLILIDWEQSDAPATTLAPEADGSWVVREVFPSATSPACSTLKYTKYKGPERRNMDEDVGGGHSWNIWNVFPIWQVKHPRALELAEVFSLGRSMWMLLRQPDMNFDDVEHPTDLITGWMDADDVPMSWREMVDCCMSTDPNQRPEIGHLAEFWEAAVVKCSDEDG
jgi:serine/threonine protein kinase